MCHEEQNDLSECDRSPTREVVQPFDTWRSAASTFRYWFIPYSRRASFSSKSPQTGPTCFFGKSTFEDADGGEALLEWHWQGELKYSKIHLSGVIGTVSHPDKQKFRIIGFFFKKIGYIGSLWFDCYYLQYLPASRPLPSRLICSSRSHNTVLYLIR